MICEVDVKPLAARSAGLLGGQGNKPGSHSPPPQAPGHQGVEDERVKGPIPRDVDEPGQVIAVPSAHLAQAVPLQLRLPVVIEQLVAKAFPHARH